MGNDGSKLKKALRAVAGNDPNYPMNVKVISVEGETCTVQLVSGLKIPDVRLNATVTDGTDYLLLTPKKNSYVTVLSADGTLANLMVVKIDKLQKFEFVQQGLEIVFDAQDKRVKIANPVVNLKDLFLALTTAVKALKVNTLAPLSPSGPITADTIAALTAIEIQVNLLLK